MDSSEVASDNKSNGVAKVTPPSSPTQSMTHTELLDAVRRQVEYYFSKENLQSDAYLTSQMDANMSVPISVVMKFAKLAAMIQQDEAVLREALENSSLTVIDDRIKANIKTGGRNTIILREIPSDVPEEEIRAIFAFDGCKPIASIRPDIEDTWFVVMDDENDAKETLQHLMFKKRLFRGSSVKARLKSDTVVRSFYSAPSMPPPMAYVPMGVPFNGAYGPMGPGGPMPNMPPDMRGYYGPPGPGMVMGPDPSMMTPLGPGGGQMGGVDPYMGGGDPRRRSPGGGGMGPGGGAFSGPGSGGGGMAGAGSGAMAGSQQSLRQMPSSLQSSSLAGNSSNSGPNSSSSSSSSGGGAGSGSGGLQMPPTLRDRDPRREMNSARANGGGNNNNNNNNSGNSNGGAGQGDDRDGRDGASMSASGSTGVTSGMDRNRAVDAGNKGVARGSGIGGVDRGVHHAGAGSKPGMADRGGAGSSGGAGTSGGRDPKNKGQGGNPGSGVRGGHGKDYSHGYSQPRPTIEINDASQFPSLQGVGDGASSDSVPVPQPGYKHNFTKYSADEIIAIVKGLPRDAAAIGSAPPANLLVEPAAHPDVLSDKPNLDLLHRQRSFSIDETRAQLQQGTPMIRLAVSGGSGGDYHNMMYGDGASASAGEREGGPAGSAAAAVAHPASATATGANTAAAVAASPSSSAASPGHAAHSTHSSSGANSSASNSSSTSSSSSGAAASSGAKSGPATWASIAKTAASTQTEGAPVVSAKPQGQAAIKKPADGSQGSAAGVGAGSPKTGGSASESSQSPAASKTAGAGAGAGRGASPQEGASRPRSSSGASDRVRREGANKKDGDDSSSTATTAGASASSSVPASGSGWGGKPTFANILKQQAEAAAANGAFAPRSSSSSSSTQTSGGTGGYSSSLRELTRGDGEAATGGGGAKTREGGADKQHHGASGREAGREREAPAPAPGTVGDRDRKAGRSAW